MTDDATTLLKRAIQANIDACSRANEPLIRRLAEITPPPAPMVLCSRCYIPVPREMTCPACDPKPKRTLHEAVRHAATNATRRGGEVVLHGSDWMKIMEALHD